MLRAYRYFLFFNKGRGTKKTHVRLMIVRVTVGFGNRHVKDIRVTSRGRHGGTRQFFQQPVLANNEENTKAPYY